MFSQSNLPLKVEKHQFFGKMLHVLNNKLVQFLDRRGKIFWQKSQRTQAVTTIFQVASDKKNTTVGQKCTAGMNPYPTQHCFCFKPVIHEQSVYLCITPDQNLLAVTTECMSDQVNVHTLHWIHTACTMKVTMSFFPDCAQFHGALNTQNQLITVIYLKLSFLYAESCQQSAVECCRGESSNPQTGSALFLFSSWTLVYKEGVWEVPSSAQNKDRRSMMH